MLVLAAILGAVIFVEMVARIPFSTALQTLARAARKALATLQSKRISDHWKERALLTYAAQIGIESLVLFLRLLTVLAPLAALTALLEAWNIPVYAYFGSLAGAATSTLAGACYAAFRARLVRRLRPRARDR